MFHKDVSLWMIALSALVAAVAAVADSAPVQISIDAGQNRTPISPGIYGTAFATPEQLSDLRLILNRSGGNGTTEYNWKLDASNHASDWFFESLPDASDAPGASADKLVQDSKTGGAEPMLTIPMIGWVANLGPGRSPLWSFSVAKYGPQQKTDSDRPDAGNGIRPDGKTPVTGNNPGDAAVPADVDFQRGWVEHLVQKWGLAGKGGVRYYLLDNEPGLWQETHRDVHPVGATMDEIWQKSRDYAAMIKSVDPGALVMGPEEWGWNGYRWSGYDQQWGRGHGWNQFPDRDRHGGEDFVPWLLDQFHAYDQQNHLRLLDYVSVHMYPQGGEFGNGLGDVAMQLRRNRSTRSLWDPNYVDETWINDKIALIPRLKAWVQGHYPGTKIAITEYNWGAEGTMNGATAQADILGIFGREGLDIATRWTTPKSGSPIYNAMKLYRNYDGNGGAFGETSVQDTVPNPDDVSSFAAIRSSDGALTVMVIDKNLSGSQTVSLSVAGIRLAGPVDVWQVAGDGSIAHLPPATAQSGTISAVVPAPSVTLFVAEPAK